MISVTYVFLPARRGYYLRLRWTEMIGDEVAKRDTKEKIPDGLFTREKVSPAKKSARADQIAAKYAAAEQDRRNGLLSLKRRDEMSLAEVWKKYERTNPEQVKPETMKTYGKWARSLLRCRCVPDSKCVAHRPPSSITLSVAEELRNLRLQECRVCGIGVSTHPAPTTWKDRDTPTHSFRALSPRTHYNEQGFLLTLIDFAVERADETAVRSKALTRLPTLIGRKGIYAKPKYEPDEFFRIFEACGGLDDRYQAMYGFAVSTGIREHPLTHFDRRWYDSERKRMTIPAEHMKGRGADYRPLDVPVSRWAARFIESSLAADRWLVWPSPANGAAQQNFSVIEDKVTKLAGLSRKVSWHAFRGTFNSWLTNHRCEKHTAEVPFFVREKLLGHALPKQVEAYTTFSDETLREALDVIDCIFDAYEKSRRGKLRAVAG